MSSTASILRRAAEVMEANGRAIGNYYAPTQGRRPYNCPVDAWGAINVACGYPPDWPDTRSVPAARALAVHVGLADTGDDMWPTVELGRWNDAPDRTASVIAAAFRGAADTAEEAGR